MIKYLSVGIAFFLTLFFYRAYGQTPAETAHQKGKQAVQLEDQGKFDEALSLLNEAERLDPANIGYPYEKTYCYYNQKLYQKVIDTLNSLKDRSDSFDRLYELLGNSYDIAGHGEKAVAVYEEGLKKFPKSGVLYLERGIIPLDKKEYDSAVGYFEKGIQAQPDFPSNYYWAAKLYCGSENPMWGLLYGEIFINLERNSQRTQEMSKLLFDTYKTHIVFTAPGKLSVSLSKNAVINNPAKFPYSMIYEPSMALATANETGIDLNSLDRIRQKFLKFYTEKGFDKTYPNALFAYQTQVTESGNMEAYNYWLLLKGDEAAFNAWQAANKTKWDDFVKWFSANPIQLNDNNRFYRTQY